MDKKILEEFNKVYDEITKIDSYNIKKWLVTMFDVLLRVHSNHTFLYNQNDKTKFTALIKQFMIEMGSKTNLALTHKCFEAIIMFLYLGSVDEKEAVVLENLGDNVDEVYGNKLTLTESYTDFENIFLKHVSNFGQTHPIITNQVRVLHAPVQVDSSKIIKDLVVSFFSELYVYISSKKQGVTMSEYFHNILSSEDKINSAFEELFKYTDLNIPSHQLFSATDSIIRSYYSELPSLKILLITQKYQENEITKLKNAKDDLVEKNKDLKTVNLELLSINSELKSTNNDLKSINNELKAFNAELANMNSELRTTNLGLTTRMNDLRDANDALTKQNRTYVEEIHTLKITNEKLREINHRLESRTICDMICHRLVEIFCCCRETNNGHNDNDNESHH